MRIDLPTLRIGALVSVPTSTCLDIDLVCLQYVLGHGLESGRTVDFERPAPAGCPSGQDEIGIPRGVIGMQVSDKRYFDVCRLQRRNVALENGRFGATHNTR